MNERLIEFTQILRQNGLRVSVAENMDELQALGCLGIEDGRLVKDGLRAALVKRSDDIELFDRLFDEYFLGLGEAVKEFDGSLMREMGLSPKAYQAWLEQIQEWLGRLESELTPLASALVRGDLTEVERLLREAAERQRLREMPNFGHDGAYLQGWRMMALASDRDRVTQQLQEFLRRAGSLGLTGPTNERLSLYVARRLEELERMLRSVIRRELTKSGERSVDRESLKRLSQKNFSYYTEEDLRRMNEAVSRLARKFRDRVTLRRKRARRGRLEIKETLRHNLQYGGVPFEMRFDQRRKEKPQVIVLCDVSDSVLNASRFMLHFVYSVQVLYRKVRSFVFVSDVGEVTHLFGEHEIHHAVEMALRGDVINVFTHSNFGRAFHLFHRDYLSAVDARTTFLIIGDGRNNYNAPNEWVLKDIRRKAKRLIWLNPESQQTWGLGDSEMLRYARYCHVAKECRNIEQLYRLMDQIVS